MSNSIGLRVKKEKRKRKKYNCLDHNRTGQKDSTKKSIERDENCYQDQKLFGTARVFVLKLPKI